MQFSPHYFLAFQWLPMNLSLSQLKLLNVAQSSSLLLRWPLSPISLCISPWTWLSRRPYDWQFWAQNVIPEAGLTSSRNTLPSSLPFPLLAVNCQDEAVTSCKTSPTCLASLSCCHVTLDILQLSLWLLDTEITHLFWPSSFSICVSLRGWSIAYSCYILSQHFVSFSSWVEWSRWDVGAWRVLSLAGGREQVSLPLTGLPVIGFSALLAPFSCRGVCELEHVDPLTEEPGHCRWSAARVWWRGGVAGTTRETDPDLGVKHFDLGSMTQHARPSFPIAAWACPENYRRHLPKVTRASFTGNCFINES